MKLATLRRAETTTAAVEVDGGYLTLPFGDVGELVRSEDWRSRVKNVVDERDGELIAGDRAEFAPVVVSPGKVLCCGLNYADHILEMGRELPEYPTLFAKFGDTLTGARDAIDLGDSDQVDWEAELAIVVGGNLTRANEGEAASAIAGYTVANDVSMRDWQNRTLQWLQGKAFDATTPIGPVLLVADEDAQELHFSVRGYVNDELVQQGDTSSLVFGPARLLSYISGFTTLRPGDVVLTGTPGGVGMGMHPPRFLTAGDVLTTEIAGIGRLQNTLVHHTTAASRAAISTH